MHLCICYLTVLPLVCFQREKIGAGAGMEPIEGT